MRNPLRRPPAPSTPRPYGHPALIPMERILAALPKDHRISGLWVQTKDDGTLPKGAGPVRVGLQAKSNGCAMAVHGDGIDTASAAERLVEAILSEAPRHGGSNDPVRANRRWT